MKFFISVLFFGFFILACQHKEDKKEMQNMSEPAKAVEMPAEQLLNTVKQDDLNTFFKEQTEKSYKEKYHSSFIRMYEKLLEKHPNNPEYQKKLKAHQDALK